MPVKEQRRAAVNRVSSAVVCVVMVCLGLSAPAVASQWQVAAEETYKLLWKPLTHTRLEVNPQQPLPADGNILDPEYAKRITITYEVSVSAERFAKMTLEALEDNFADDELAPHRAQIEQFCSWFLPVEKGDRYSLDWRPQAGLTLAHNGSALGTLEDPAASAVVLSVWLGRAAVSESQRDDMLQQWRKMAR